MFSLDKFFGKGTKGTVLLKNGTNFSYHGPWKKVTQNTEIDRFLVNDFCAAEYTIVIDLSSSAKEIIKALVVAGPNDANVTIYGRSNLNQDLLTLTATVNDSTVSLTLSELIHFSKSDHKHTSREKSCPNCLSLLRTPTRAQNLIF